MEVRPKKRLGQHFLKDMTIAEKIVNALSFHDGYHSVIEIGPGTGVLTRFLMHKPIDHLILMEIDEESIAYLNKHYHSTPHMDIIQADFLKADLKKLFQRPFGIIGNFPYNISSQILFKLLEYRDSAPELVGMFQKEVALRICSKEGNKVYGILSVLIGAFYKREYLFTVPREVFLPPPKVESGVIRLKRKTEYKLDCDEKAFFRVVKQGFQNRRKTLWNALKPINLPEELRSDPVFRLRAEQLSIPDFIELTNKITSFGKPDPN